MSMINEYQKLEVFPPPVISAIDPALSSPLQKGLMLHKSGDLNGAGQVYAQILKQSPDDPYSLTFMGLIQANAGDLDSAYKLISRAVRKNSRVADIHFALGNVLQVQGRVEQAKKAYMWALALGHAHAPGRLGIIYSSEGGESRLLGGRQLAEVLLSLGKPVDAFNRIREDLLAYPEDALLWELFSRCLVSIRFQSRAQKEVLHDMLKAFLFDGINHQIMLSAALSALQFEPELSSFLSISAEPDNVHEVVKQRFTSGDLQPVADSQLFCGLLKVTIINDVRMEVLLTALRSAFLLGIDSSDSEENALVEKHMALLCSLAQQCFLNEYIYVQTPREDEALERLVKKLQPLFESGRSVPPQWLVVIAAYRPLFGLTIAKRIVDQSWQGEVGDIVQLQLVEKFEDEKIRGEIESLTTIQEGVSHHTRLEYEEYPFPRWPSLSSLGSLQTFEAFISSHLPDIKKRSLVYSAAPQILVAGCGTGLDACILAKRIKNSSVTGVDLSRTSLTFAIRKSTALGLSNIRFFQADIMELARAEKQYDHINCFGVLQLLQDTEAGLGILKDCLVSGGTMLIALYSTIGRRAVAQTRQYITQQGYRANAEDMRQCRQNLIAMRGREFASSIVNSLAFYNMSNFRDLVFHSLEKTLTLLQLKEMLDRLDLEFLGFELSDPAVRAQYRHRYPQDIDMTSLDTWHEFEQAYPDTFANCHAFWLRG